MATSCVIGHENPDGSYVGVRCHYDGYPEHMGPTLAGMHYVDVVIMVSKALLADGLRAVGPDKPGGFETFPDRGSKILAEVRWPPWQERYSYKKMQDGSVEVFDTHTSKFFRVPSSTPTE